MESIMEMCKIHCQILRQFPKFPKPNILFIIQFISSFASLLSIRSQAAVALCSRCCGRSRIMELTTEYKPVKGDQVREPPRGWLASSSRGARLDSFGIDFGAKLASVPAGNLVAI